MRDFTTPEPAIECVRRASIARSSGEGQSLEADGDKDDKNDSCAVAAWQKR